MTEKSNCECGIGDMIDSIVKGMIKDTIECNDPDCDCKKSETTRENTGDKTIQKEYTDFMSTSFTDIVLDAFDQGYQIVKKDEKIMDVRRKTLADFKGGIEGKMFSTINSTLKHLETMEKLRKTFVKAHAEYVFLQMLKEDIEKGDKNE